MAGGRLCPAILPNIPAKSSDLKETPKNKVKNYLKQLEKFFEQYNESENKFFNEDKIWFEGKPKLPDYGRQRENLFAYETMSGRSNSLNSLGDRIYAIQDALALRYFVEKLNTLDRSQTFIDVASAAQTMLHFAQFARCYYVDPRSLYPDRATDVALTLGLAWVKGEGQQLSDIFGDKFTSIVTSLHAPEHFGLGRYGDQIDYDGTLKFMREVHKTLKDDGTFIMSVPYSWCPRVEFHNARVFDLQILSKHVAASNFEIEKATIILPGSFPFIHGSHGGEPPKGLKFLTEHRLKNEADNRWSTGRNRFADWVRGGQKEEQKDTHFQTRQNDLYSSFAEARPLNVESNISYNDRIQFLSHFEFAPPESNENYKWEKQIDKNMEYFLKECADGDGLSSFITTPYEHTCVLLVLRKKNSDLKGTK